MKNYLVSQQYYESVSRVYSLEVKGSTYFQNMGLKAIAAAATVEHKGKLIAGRGLTVGLTSKTFLIKIDQSLQKIRHFAKSIAEFENNKG
jgi:hypothetical protein